MSTRTPTINQATSWRELIKHFEIVLKRAVEQRDQRPEIIPTPGEPGGEFAWEAYEREVMLDAVNDARTRRGIADIATMDSIVRAEQSAAGHFDYIRKFALQCAHLATGAEGPY